MSVVFLHLRKTGGTSYRQIVLRHVPRAQRVHLDAPTLARAIEKWAALPNHRRTGATCLHGHLPFGVHRLLPGPVTYLTLLRDPIERVVSAYFYALRRPEERLHELLVRTGMSLAEYVEHPDAAGEHDLQTGMLAGEAEPGEPADAVARALRRLVERFAVVGVAERFDETVLHTGRVMGWRNVLYRKDNVNRRRTPVADLPAATLAAIRERNAGDLALHRRAGERLDAALAGRPLAPGTLSAFRAANRAYGLAARAVGLPRAILADARAARRRREIALKSAARGDI
jgi:hypothetical protein